jgi:hypothetical protein
MKCTTGVQGIHDDPLNNEPKVRVLVTMATTSQRPYQQNRNRCVILAFNVLR